MIRKMQYVNLFYPEKPELNIEPINEKARAYLLPHASVFYTHELLSYAFSEITTQNYKNIFLIGPSHYYDIKRPVISEYDKFETPYGFLQQNKRIIKKIKFAEINNNAHLKEHSLEVFFPFIKKYTKAKIIPILTNNFSKELSFFLDNFKEDLIIVSSDLSHYHPDKIAKKLDKDLLDTIVKITYHEAEIKELYNKEACGLGAIITLMDFVKRNNLKTSGYTYYNSSLINKDTTKVVGYAKMRFYDEQK